MAFVLVLTFQFGVAQVKSKTDSDTINTVLFEVTSSNHNHVSYLFGTHHAFGKVFFDSLTKAKQALASSELLIKENLNIPGEMAEDIINRRTQITQWKKYLSKADLTYIKNLFATSPTDFNKMTPTEMYVFLTRHFKQQICLNENANDNALTLDDYIAYKAVEQNIELYGYSRMDMDYQRNIPCRNVLILTDRNNRWIKKISNLLEVKNCFIAVGLSHLMYECGLINKLTELGYTIIPIAVK